MTIVSPLPRVILLTLGGTIASLPDRSGGAVPAIDAEALAAGIPALREAADLVCLSFRKVPGAHIEVADLVELAALAHKLASEGTSAMVVTQGTDTIEETAFALDLMAGNALPIIVTGAMRGPTEPGTDGPANLIGAVRVAASGATLGLGVVVLMDDVLHSARWVRKMHTTRPSAFCSAMTGPLGWITEDRVSVAWRPPNFPKCGEVTTGSGKKVALLSTWLGDDGRLIDHAVEVGYAGLVVQATGGGHVNPSVAAAIGRAAQRLPVVFASRAGAGEILRKTYGFPGSETDLLLRGAIPAGPLDAVKARLLLELLLLRTGHSVADGIRDFNLFASACTSASAPKMPGFE
jgi:L-asparaginase